MTTRNDDTSPDVAKKTKGKRIVIVKDKQANNKLKRERKVQLKLQEALELNRLNK